MARRKRLNSEGRAAMRVRLYERSGGYCEFCGGVLTWAAEVHHRQLRAQGGSDDPVNLAIIHPECHRWTHANPAAARDRGWIVSGWADPATVPVTVQQPRSTP